MWPEDVVSLYTPIDGTPTERQLAALAIRLKATLVVGVTETVSSQTFRNEIVRVLARRQAGGTLREGPPRALR